MIFFVPQPHHQGLPCHFVAKERHEWRTLSSRSIFLSMSTRDPILWNFSHHRRNLFTIARIEACPWTNWSFFSSVLKSSWPKRPRKSSCERYVQGREMSARLCLFSRSSSVCRYYQLVPDGISQPWIQNPLILWHARRATVLLSFPTEKKKFLAHDSPEWKERNRA